MHSAPQTAFLNTTFLNTLVKLTNSEEAENYSLGRLFLFVRFHQLNTIYYIIFTPKSLSLSVLVAQKKKKKKCDMSQGDVNYCWNLVNRMSTQK